MYPGGDYGQISLNGDAEIRQAYTEAARQVLPWPLCPQPTAITSMALIPCLCPCAMCMPGWMPKPSRRCRKIIQPVLQYRQRLCWQVGHGQLPRAEMLFARAAALGVSPADNAYYRASNALFDEDAPYANELAREAKRLDPDNPRTDVLVGRAERLLHPRVSFNPRGWTDQ